MELHTEGLTAALTRNDEEQIRRSLESAMLLPDGQEPVYSDNYGNMVGNISGANSFGPKNTNFNQMNNGPNMAQNYVYQPVQMPQQPYYGYPGQGFYNQPQQYGNMIPIGYQQPMVNQYYNNPYGQQPMYNQNPYAQPQPMPAAWPQVPNQPDWYSQYGIVNYNTGYPCKYGSLDPAYFPRLQSWPPQPQIVNIPFSTATTPLEQVYFRNKMIEDNNRKLMLKLQGKEEDPVEKFNGQNDTITPIANNTSNFNPYSNGFSNPYGSWGNIPNQKYTSEPVAIREYHPDGTVTMRPYYNNGILSSNSMNPNAMSQQLDPNKYKLDNMAGQRMFLKMCKIAAVGEGIPYDEEAIIKKWYGDQRTTVLSPEDIKRKQTQDYYNYLNYLMMHPELQDSSYIRYYRMIGEMSANMHRELDNHSLAQFLGDDLWRLEREFWIRENIDKNQSRNLSKMYDKDEYNELLTMHALQNPHMKQILDTSRYDNNKDDVELAVAELEAALKEDKERTRRKLDILTGKVPYYISSPEVQESRRKWTEIVTGMVEKKNQMRGNKP